MPKEKGSDEPRSKIGLEMRPSLHKRLKVLSVLTDRAMWELTDEAMTQYLDREERHRPLYPLGVVLVGFLRALTPRSAILLRSSVETAASKLTADSRFGIVYLTNQGWARKDRPVRMDLNLIYGGETV